MRYPAMRVDLMASIEDLARIESLQQPSPAGSLLDYAVHFLFDDTGLAEDASSCVGVFLANEAEAVLVSRVCDAVDAVFQKYGTELSDPEYSRCPEWTQVVRSAQAAQILLSSWEP